MDDCVGSFLRFLVVAQGAAAHTVAAYRTDLQQFAGFAAGRCGGTGGASIDRALITAYVRALQSQPYTAATVARKVAAVHSFVGFLLAAGLLPAAPTDARAAPRGGPPRPTPLSPPQVAKLLAQPRRRTTPAATRDTAMLELLYATGIRVTELVALDVESVVLRPAGACVRCVGKGAQARTVPVHEHAAAALRVYLDEARPLLLRDQTAGALFVNRRGARLTRQGVWLLLKSYAAAAKLGGALTPHTLRHCFAAHLLHGGAPLWQVQAWLGHAARPPTPATPRATAAPVRTVYERAHPRAHEQGDEQPRHRPGPPDCGAPPRC